MAGGVGLRRLLNETIAKSRVGFRRLGWSGSFGGSGAIVGNTWESKITLAIFNDDKLSSRMEFFDNGANIDAIKCTIGDTANEKIAEVRLFVNYLYEPLNKFQLLQKWFTHHFVGITIQSGRQFTAEKLTDCILLQSCPPVEKLSGAPIIWRHRAANERYRLPTLRMAHEMQMDPHSSSKSFVDVIKWCQAEQLEKYHVAESSCQDFARNLCMKVFQLPYPNPAKYAPVFPFRE